MKKYGIIALAIPLITCCMEKESTTPHSIFKNPLIEETIKELDPDKIANIKQLSEYEKRIIALEACTLHLALQQVAAIEKKVKKDLESDPSMQEFKNFEESFTLTDAQKNRKESVIFLHTPIHEVFNKIRLQRNTQASKCAQQ